MVLLVSFDSEQFIVDKVVAERSAVIKKMLEGKKCSSLPRHTLSDHLVCF